MPADDVDIQRRPRDRKSSILAAAADLFAAGGFSAVGIDEIGERVGITGPAIYRHFKGKDALLGAVLLDVVTAYEVDDAALEEGLHRVVADAVTTALDHPSGLATYVHERRRLAGDDRRPVAAAEKRLRQQWHRAIGAAQPELSEPEIGARFAAMLAALSAVALRPATVVRPQLDRLLTEALLAMLLAPTSESGPTPKSGDAWSPPHSRAEAILSCALALFHQRGFHGVGIDDIGEAAGISGPTVYFYYESKLDILMGAFDRAGARVSAGAHDALTGASSATDALARLIASYLEVVNDNVDLIAVTSREFGVLPEADRSNRSRLRRQVRDTWVAVLRELRPGLGEGAARTLVAGVFPLMIQLSHHGIQPTEAAPLASAFLLGEAESAIS
ncbi:MAG: TetR/AcrR family transcriptional regulator [Acidimicrobiales bacterium]|jgi:AcrR family transcriptional regulator